MSTIITFYSYKGGVGRSMAMANIAVLMAQRGLKVLAVDWDLEAPGLERYFSYFEQSPAPGGLLPFFSEINAIIEKKSKFPKYTYSLWKIEVDENHVFDLIPSGRESHQGYASMLEDFSWRKFFSNGGGDFIEDLRNQWKADYDFVLIDSRTGMSDSGGICTVQMPDVLVAMFTANDQSMLGVLDIIHASQRGRQRLAYDRMPLTVLPVVSRFPGRTEVQESNEWYDKFDKSFQGICDDWLMPWIPLRKMFERLRIPQVDWFSFGERLAVIEQGTSEPGGVGYSLDRITDLLSSDFSDIDTSLGSLAKKPANWEKSKIKSKVTKRKIREQDDYKYDLYISYKRGGVLNEWVESFIYNLTSWLEVEMIEPPQIFLNIQDVDSMSSVNSAIDYSIKHSKLLIALLTPAYFASDFCIREWLFFEKREKQSMNAQPLILPILLRGGDLLPDHIKRRQLLNASESLMSFTALKRSGTSKGEYDLLQLVSQSITKMLENAPPFDPNWDSEISEKEIYNLKMQQVKPRVPKLS